MPNVSKEDREWSDKVVEEYQEEIESLPAIDEPSGLQKRLQMGAVLINSGATTAEAARQVGVEYSKLMLFYKDKVVSATPEVKEQQEKIIRDQAVEGLMRAQEKLIEMLQDDEMRPAEVTKAAKEMRDTVALLDNWKEGTRDGGDKTKGLLGDLVRGVLEGRVKVDPKKDPVEEAIDVTSERDAQGSTVARESNGASGGASGDSEVTGADRQTTDRGR